MASPNQVVPGPETRSLAEGPLGDLQDILADTLEDVRFYENKNAQGNRVADLLQAKTALLSSAAEACLQSMQNEHADQLQQLRLDVADRDCQLVSARADMDQWKRRAGVLFLKMSSVQEDVDMYAMRCRLLEAEASRESVRTQTYKAKAGGLQQRLAACQEELQSSQNTAQALQAQLDEAHQNAEELSRQASSVQNELGQCKRATAAQAAAAAEKLAEAKAGHESAASQAAAAKKAAEEAEKRCEELTWRLQQQDAALAQRAQLAEDARAATEGLSKEGIQAVREKASFLEHELREQLADARRFLEDERAARRAAEASLATQLEQARADAGALRTRLNAAKDSDNHREAKQALDVVSSLVQDLAPPDSVAKKPSATDQGSSHEQQQQIKDKNKTSAEVQVQQQQRNGKKTSTELQTVRKAPSNADKAGKASADDDVTPAGKTARNGVGRKQKAGEAPADKCKAPAAAEKAAQKGADKQQKPAKEPSEAAKAPAGKAAARKRTAAAAAAPEKNSPEQGEATAGRRARRRESKAPWWMAQVVSPIAETTEDAAVGGSNGKRTCEQQQMQEESDYEPTAVKKAQARKLVKHVGKSRAAAKAAVIAEPEEDGAAAADEEKPRSTKRRKAAVEEPAAEAHARKRTKASTSDEAAALPEDVDTEMEVVPAAKDSAAEAAGTAKVGGKAAPAGQAGASKAPAGGAPTRGASKAHQLQSQSTQSAESHDSGTDDVDSNVRKEVAGKEQAVAQAQLAARMQQRAQDSRASTQTAGVSEGGTGAVDAPAAGKGHRGALHGQAAAPKRVPAKGEQEGATAKQVPRWEKARPDGVSRIDLSTVWGGAVTPLTTAGDQSAAAVGAKNKENPANAAGKAPTLEGIMKPIPGRSRFNSAMEANPLAALNPRVLEAAGALRPSFVSGLTAPNRPSNGGQAPLGKRKLLPAPKPLGGNVGALSQDELFGQGFKVPKLGR